MASQVFYRKWRPQTLAQVVGQEAVTQTLRNALIRGRVSHAYLFSGPRGTGKTSTARILAKAVNCLSQENGEPCNTCSLCRTIVEGRALDIIEIDAASNTGVEDIRNLREKVGYAPHEARYKVYIIDEVHMLSNPASNALLKTLEEPPPHVIFILATTEPHKLLPTILSRCQRFDFRRLSLQDVIAKLAQICRSEGIQIAPEALRLIAKSATGSLRDAENLLEQLTTYYGSEITLQQVQALLGVTGDWRVRELVKHIVGNGLPAGIATINSINRDGLDLRQFNRELVEYLRALLLVKTGSDEAVDLTSEDIAELKDLAARASLEQILRATKLFGQLELGLDSYSPLPLELALVDCLLAPEVEKESPAPKGEDHLPETTPLPPRPKQPETTPLPPRPKQPVAQREPSPAPPMPSPVMASPSSRETASEIEHLRQNWKQLIAQAPPEMRKTQAMAILRSANFKLEKVDKDTVYLSFQHLVHKEMLEKVENQRVAERIISHFLGHPCRLLCVQEDNHLVRAAQKMGAQIIQGEEK